MAMTRDQMPKTEEEYREMLAALPEEDRANFQQLMDFLKPWETLDPELAACKEESASTNMTWIKHPLVFQMAYMEGIQDGQLNTLLARKKEVRDDARAEQNWRTFVFIHERAYRLWAFLQIADEISDDCAYWDLVGDIWTDSENVHEHYEDWHTILHADRSQRECMMDKDERQALAKLGDTLTIYRGYRESDWEVWDGLEGFSWTLSRPKAVWFANRWEKAVGDNGKVATARVAKENVIAYFTGRGEQEIITLPEHVMGVRTVNVRG